MQLLWIAVLAVTATSLGCEGRRIPRQSGSKPKRIVCYYQNWSIWRPDDQNFVPADINPNICTHIIYAYAKIQMGDEALAAFDPEGDIQRKGYEIFVGLKKDNPSLKLILSAGGGREGSGLFSQIASDPDRRTQFITGAIRFVRLYNFDGFDLSWQWPGLGRGSAASDRDNFVIFAKEMRDAIIKDAQETSLPELTFSIVSPKFEQELTRGFNLKELAKYIDFFNVQSYGYHTSADPTVHHLAPLFTLPDEEINTEFTVDSTVTAYSKTGIDLEKLNLGIPLFGLSFFLADAGNNYIGAEADEEGDGVERGALWYNQICKRVTQSEWTIMHVNRTAMGPYAFNNTLWVAYDDEEAVRNKARYASDRGIGGIMFWSIDLDDFRGNCHFRAYPLIRAGAEVFGSSTSEEAPASLAPIIPFTVSVPVPRTMPIPSPVTIPPTTKEHPTASTISSTGSSEKQVEDSPASKHGVKITSNRDVLIQQFRIWVTNNYFGGGQPSPQQSSNVISN